MNKKKNLIKKALAVGVWVIVLGLIPGIINEYKNNRLLENDSYVMSDYKIDDYDVTLNVDRNNRIDVIEKVSLNLPSDGYIGISRRIPLTMGYMEEDDVFSKRIKVSNFHVDGEKYDVNSKRDYVDVKIGNSRQVKEMGNYTYTMRYRISYGKDYNRGYDELVYNIFDNYKDTKISEFNLAVNMPYAIDDSVVSFYKNGENITGQVNYYKVNNSIYVNLSGVNIDSNITLNVKLKDGYFVGTYTNYGYISMIIYIVIIIMMLISYILWKKFGKDHRKYVSSVEFYPPDKIDAACLGYLYGERNIKKLTTALLVSLASKNYISIHEIGNAKYEIIKLINIPDDVSANELLVFQELFKDRDKVTLYGNSSFGVVFAKINSAIINLFDRNVYDKESAKMMRITFTMLMVSMIMYVISSVYINDMAPIYNSIKFVAFVSIFLIGILAIIMDRKTTYGEELYAKVIGFKKYLDLVEKDKVNDFAKEHPNYFYDILPYTYVLGVSKKWMETFKKNNLDNIDVDLNVNSTYEDGMFMIIQE